MCYMHGCNHSKCTFTYSFLPYSLLFIVNWQQFSVVTSVTLCHHIHVTCPLLQLHQWHSTSLPFINFCTWKPYLFSLLWPPNPSFQLWQELLFLPHSCRQEVEWAGKRDAYLQTMKPEVESSTWALCNWTPRHQTWSYKILCLPFLGGSSLVLVQVFLAVLPFLTVYSMPLYVGSI